MRLGGKSRSSAIESLGNWSSLTSGEVELRKERYGVHKLDVLSSAQFNRICVINVIICTFTFIHVFALLGACKTVWNGLDVVKGVDNKPLRVETCDAPLPYMIVLYLFDLAGRCFLILFSIFYIVRIATCKKTQRSQEQAWCAMMVITTALSYTPLLNLYMLHDRMFAKDIPGQHWYNNNESFRLAIAASRGVNLLLSSAGQLFYLWACAHSYGILEEEERPSAIRFYTSKVSLLVVYSSVRLVLRFKLKISPSKLPVITLLTMISNFNAMFSSVSDWPLDVTLQVLGYTLLEIIFVVALIRRIFITCRKLQSAGYLKYRTKQLGFRFFLMQNFIAYSFFILADALIMTSIPRDFSIFFFLNPPRAHFFFNFRYGPVPRILNYTTTIITAYVNLPADSEGLMGWFRGTGEESLFDKEPITLSVYHDTRAKFSSHYFSSRYVFDLQVLLFNLADIAYTFRKQSERNIALEYLTERGYIVEMEIYDEASDDFAVLLSSKDRIIVTFKGSTSSQNMKTDLRMMLTNLSDVLPTIMKDDANVLKRVEWKAARIHQGFADSYRNLNDKIIGKLGELLRVSSRPIYFTGHSLGGALATICSLDVVLSLEFEDVYVTTFGSPKCGNFFWSRFYDSSVPAHWRVAMRSDIITTLPHIGYSHAGKRVALSTNGEMFLDPNAIESSFWSFTGLGVADHSKAAYKDALILFACKYIPEYTPKFLNKISKEPGTKSRKVEYPTPKSDWKAKDNNV